MDLPKIKQRNKKAQLDNPVIAVAISLIALIIMGIVIMKVYLSIQAPVMDGFKNLTIGGETASTNFNHVLTVGITSMDYIILAFFVIMVIMMFISSFMIESHPIFLILYIGITFLFFMVAPSIIKSADELYESALFVNEVSYLPILDYIRTYYGELVIGLMVVTGIIIYGKLRSNK